MTSNVQGRPTSSEQDRDKDDSGYSSSSRSASDSSRGSNDTIFSKSMTDSDNEAAAQGLDRTLRKQLRLGATKSRRWVSMIYEKTDETFDSGEWLIGEAVCLDREFRYGMDQSWARGNYKCTKNSDDGKIEQAIMKIYLQTQGRCARIPYEILAEIEALDILKAKNQESSIRSPKLIDHKKFKQELWSWVPESGVVMILMTICPGNALNLAKFYRTKLDEREKIRMSFTETMRELYSVGVVPRDISMHNLLWHKEQASCYIIDFEGASVWSQSQLDRFCPDLIMERWHLKGWHWQFGRLMHSLEGAEMPPSDVSGSETEESLHDEDISEIDSLNSDDSCLDTGAPSDEEQEPER